MTVRGKQFQRAAINEVRNSPGARLHPSSHLVLTSIHHLYISKNDRFELSKISPRAESKHRSQCYDGLEGRGDVVADNSPKKAYLPTSSSKTIRFLGAQQPARYIYPTKYLVHIFLHEHRRTLRRCSDSFRMTRFNHVLFSRSAMKLNGFSDNLSHKLQA